MKSCTKDSRPRAVRLNLGDRENDTESGDEDNHAKHKVEDDPNSVDFWLLRSEWNRRFPVVRFKSSMLASSSQSPLRIGKYFNLTYRTSQAETWLISTLLNTHGFTEVPHPCNEFNLLWTGSHPRPHTFSSLAPYQRVNHFPRSYEITRKDRLYKNVERMQHSKGQRHFDFIPPSFVMPTEYREFWSAHHRLHGPWIVKPVASSRGRGIYIVSKPEEVPLEEPVLVSKYLDNPLLVDGHKCDLRLYVAVTSYDPLVIYLYREGLVRFAAVKYNSSDESLDNPCIHLCNYSINKYHSDFVISQDPSAEDVGHKRSLSGLLRWLRTHGHDVALLMRRIEDLVIKSIVSVAPPVAAACKMFVPHRNTCFELYGFDVLLDADLKPWLLEVNLSPSLGCESPLDLRIKSAMLADLLTLVGIPATDPNNPPATQRQGRSRTADKSQPYRRAQSADAHRQRNKSTHKSGTNTPTLTAEEQRVLAQIRDEYNRKGDFVRIFPTAETWGLYGEYLQSAPFQGTSYAFSAFNQVVHDHLFPPVVNPAALHILSSNSKNRINSAQPRMNSSHRSRKKGANASQASPGSGFQPRPVEETTSVYEQTFARGYIAAPTTEKSFNDKELFLKSIAQKKLRITEFLEQGHVFSQVNARQAFGKYLRCVLNRLPELEQQESLNESTSQLDLIERFLQRMTLRNQRTPSPAKSPVKKLQNKDRLAILSNQLFEFLDKYDKETLAISNLESPSQAEEKLIPSQTVNDFLETASEKDLEEVLCLQTRTSIFPYLFLGRAGTKREAHTVSNIASRTHAPRTLNFLREACNINQSHTFRSATMIQTKTSDTSGKPPIPEKHRSAESRLEKVSPTKTRESFEKSLTSPASSNGSSPVKSRVSSARREHRRRAKEAEAVNVAKEASSLKDGSAVPFPAKPKTSLQNFSAPTTPVS